MLFLNYLPLEKGVNVFSQFCNNLPLEKGVALNLNKLESPSPKNALCQFWLKLAQWFWRRRFLNFVNVFSLFGYYLPLEKGGALHLNKLESPLPKDALWQVWLKLAQWFWRRRWKCEKFTTTTTTTTTTDNGQILIRKAHLSLWLRWTKKCYNMWLKESAIGRDGYYFNPTCAFSLPSSRAEDRTHNLFG